MEVEQAVREGKLNGLMEQWVPWWMQSGCAIEIEEEEEEEDDGEMSSRRMPRILKEIPKFSTLSRKEPSPLLPFILVGMLWSYVLTKRR